MIPGILGGQHRQDYRNSQRQNTPGWAINRSIKLRRCFSGDLSFLTSFEQGKKMFGFERVLYNDKKRSTNYHLKE